MTKIYLLLLVATFSVSQTTFGQNQRVIDSLNIILAEKRAGDRYPQLYELAFEYFQSDTEKSLKLIECAEKAALLSGDSLWIVKSKRVRGLILYKLERTAEIIPLFESALEIARRNKFDEEYKVIINSFGVVYVLRAEFDKALEKFNGALKFGETLRDTLYLVSVLDNSGMAYYKLQNPRQALFYLLRAMKLSQVTNQRVDIWGTCINTSLCYSALHEPSRAEVYLRRAIEQCGEGCSEEREMHQDYARGRIHYELKQYDHALRYFSASLSKARKIHDSRMALDNITVISELFLASRKIKEAERYLLEAEKLIAAEVPFPMGHLSVYSQLCEVYDQMKNYRKLALYQHRYIHLRDSVFNDELTARLMATEAEFKQRENETKIASQGAIISLNAVMIHRQKILNVVTTLLALLTVAFATVLFVNFRRKQRLNQLLEQKVRERTMELEHSRDEMLRMLEEKDLRMRQASYAITTSVNSIEGLCLTGRREVSLPLIHSYLQRIGNASRAIVGNVEEYLRNGVLQEVS